MSPFAESTFFSWALDIERWALRFPSLILRPLPSFSASTLQRAVPLLPAFGASRTGGKPTPRLVHDGSFGSERLNDFFEARIAAERVRKEKKF
jgi:hypothetical protein